MKLKSLICLSLLLCFFQSAFAQTVLTASYVTPAACTGGSSRSGFPIILCGGPSSGLATNFILGTDLLGSTAVDTIQITGSGITLDLGGYTISGGSVTCAPSFTAPFGNSCTGTGGSVHAVNVSGDNVTIKNGFVANVNGTCILSGGLGTSISNVTATSCRGDGFKFSGIGKNLVANSNGQEGIYLTFGSVDSSTASNNNLDGFNTQFQTTVTNSSAYYNGTSGFFLSGGTANNVAAQLNGTGIIGNLQAQVLNSTAASNTNAGVDFTGGAGDVANTTAFSNGTFGFKLSTSTCYLNVTTSGNTSGSISGGSAFASGVCAH